MTRSVDEIYAVLAAVVQDPGGFPLRATMAAVANAESNGNPNAYVPHDPPTNPDAAPSSGALSLSKLLAAS